MRVAALVACMALARIAHADLLYKAEVAGSDALGVGLIATGSYVDDPVGEYLIYFGVVTTIVGAPIVHSLHGDDDWAGHSFLLRLGLPAAGTLVGAALSPLIEHCDDCFLRKGPF